MSSDPSAPRGLDGLTSAELAASRRGLWDDGLTELILRYVPVEARTVLDVGCGLAASAHALLPRLRGFSYVGVDADERRLADAAALLEGTAYRDRVTLRLGRAERLPCADGAESFVLATMTLQHLADPAAALREVRRILAPAGAFLAMEPDNASNLFYFDGALGEVNRAFRLLFEAQRRLRRPADTCLGPALARLAEEAGLAVKAFFPHAVGRARRTSGRSFLAGLRRTVDVVAAGFPAHAPEPGLCRAAIADAEASLGDAPGYGCQLVPVFVCVAALR